MAREIDENPDKKVVGPIGGDLVCSDCDFRRPSAGPGPLQECPKCGGELTYDCN